MIAEQRLSTCSCLVQCAAGHGRRTRRSIDAPIASWIRIAATDAVHTATTDPQITLACRRPGRGCRRPWQSRIARPSTSRRSTPHTCGGRSWPAAWRRPGCAPPPGGIASRNSARAIVGDDSERRAVAGRQQFRNPGASASHLVAVAHPHLVPSRRPSIVRRTICNCGSQSGTPCRIRRPEFARCHPASTIPPSWWHHHLLTIANAKDRARQLSNMTSAAMRGLLASGTPAGDARQYDAACGCEPRERRFRGKLEWRNLRNRLPASRTRRAISCVTWLPKSTMRIESLGWIMASDSERRRPAPVRRGKTTHTISLHKSAANVSCYCHNIVT